MMCIGMHRELWFLCYADKKYILELIKDFQRSLKKPTKFFGGQGSKANQRIKNSDKFCEKWNETGKRAISKATLKLFQIQYQYVLITFNDMGALNYLQI